MACYHPPASRDRPLPVTSELSRKATMPAGKPVRIAVTGAAGQIGYALIFRIAAGDMLGLDQPVSLHLLEIPQALGSLQGTVMELRDCAFPLLHEVVATDQPEEAFAGVDVAMLVGARPRGPGMERKDLLSANAQIFSVQGKAINDHADRGGARAGGRQPRQHQRADRDVERAEARSPPVHRDDAPRSQPRQVAARGADRRARERDPPDDDLGQPLGDAGARSAPLPGRAASRRRRWSTRPGRATPSSPPCSSAAPR